jgi:hypothetical protein
MPSTQDVTDKIGKTLVDHLPVILTGVGVVGVVVTPVLAYKARPKVEAIQNSEEYIEAFANAESPAKEKVVYIKYTWTKWAPVAISGVITVGAIIGAHVSSSMQKAALLAAYGTATTAISEYKKHLDQVVPDKDQRAKIDEEVAEKVKEENPEPHKKHHIRSDDDEERFFDWYTSREFKSTQNKVDAAVNKVNFEVNSDGWCSLNNFYYYLGLAPIGVGDDIGWTTDKLLQVSYSSILTEDVKPAVMVEFNTLPKSENRL